MNYGEEYALWYLRLNGFFPLSNFVIHRTDEIEHSSDCDILAIRTPNVFEEVGGQPDDWDEWLYAKYDLTKTIGIICEVKTGRYQEDKLFKNENIQYCIGRLGFVPNNQIREVSGQFINRSVLTVNENYQLGKLLIAEEGHDTDNYLYLPLEHTMSFLQQRVNRYPKEKYGDRMFFSSILFQSVIDRVVKKRK